MTKNNKAVLITRLRSFAWRAGMFLTLFSLNFLAENAGLFGFSTVVVALISYVASEITKQLNS